jgi:hypothetical protein
MEDSPIQDSGADTQVQVAESEANQAVEVAGAEPEESQTAEDGGDKGEQEEKEVTEEAVEEEKSDKGEHQLTLEERVAQVVEKRMADLEAKFAEQQKQQEAEAPKHAPAEIVSQLQDMINGAILREQEILSDFQIEDDPGAKNKLAQELRQIRKWLPGAEEAIEQNEAMRTEWETKQAAQNQRQQQVQQVNTRIFSAVEMICEAEKIPADVKAEGEKFFKAARDKDPVLAAEYEDIIWGQGPVKAAKFAIDYVKQNMGKGAQADKVAKEKAKSTQVGGAGGGLTPDGVKSWDKLMERPSTEINKFAREHPKAFETLKKARFQ